jgi:hypothetical protein
MSKKEEEIVGLARYRTVNAEQGKALVSKAHHRLLSSLNDSVVNTVVGIIQQKQQVLNEIQKLNIRLELLGEKLSACEAGKISFDSVSGRLTFDEERLNER